MIRKLVFLLLLGVAWRSALSHRAQDPDAPFAYDQVARTHAARLLPDSAEAYAPSLLALAEGGLLSAWLRHDAEATTPRASAEQLVLSWRAADDSDAEEERALALRGRLRSPLLVQDGAGQVWVSLEISAEVGAPWIVHAAPVRWEELATGRRRVRVESEELVACSQTQANALHHRAVGLPQGGLRLVWQAECAGQWDLWSAPVDERGRGELREITHTSTGDWAPDLACDAAGNVLIVWDAWTGESFDVHGRWLLGRELMHPFVVADGPALQARARVVAGPDDRMWIAWEEGEENWGAPFRGKKVEWNNVTDASGPLHRFRLLRFAEANAVGGMLPAPELVLPGLEPMRTRRGRRPGVEHTGIWYERPELAVDGEGGVWVAYRHGLAPQLGLREPTRHHVDEGWRIHLRRLGAEGWSELHGLDVPQRDGTQALALAGTQAGVRVLMHSGRTDRRANQGERGLFEAGLELGGGAPGPSDPELAEARMLRPYGREARGWDGIELDGLRPRLGDLHRHTDLSLCFPFYDGSIDDAYRYATEVARLDFLGITDHTRDLNRGNVDSQLWRRCTLAVEAYSLTDAFVPMWAFERSHGNTDHNVVTMDPGVLRNFPPPLAEYWAEIDPLQTITIPHNPFTPKVWDVQDDARRPLLEIYQGCRDEDSVEHAVRGLAAGHRLGFIASSDHMATQAGYAGVWTERLERRAVFDALRTRRTFAATAPIVVALRCGETWMGEVGEAGPGDSLEFHAWGTAPVSWVGLWSPTGDLAVRRDLGTREVYVSWELQALPEGEDCYYVQLVQEDGNQAWSSPIWLRAPGD